MSFSTNIKLKSLLDTMVEKMNHRDFIQSDPISIPHQFSNQADIEISGFFSAIFSWGNRKTIISKASTLMDFMDRAPYDFILGHEEKDLEKFCHFTHRTFQYTDLLYFVAFLKHHYSKSNTLEEAFFIGAGREYSQKDALTNFHNYFFSLPFAPDRTQKHISTPFKNSTCKRLNMFLRWMVRKDDQGVDFGLWKNIPVSKLMIPFDVHVEKTARKLGLLERKQRDWLAVEELTNNLRTLDVEDPIRYDYALFGMSIEKMI